MVLMAVMTSHRRLNRWLWFAGLYAAGVVTLAVVAYGLRALLQALRWDDSEAGRVQAARRVIPQTRYHVDPLRGGV